MLEVRKYENTKGKKKSSVSTGKSKLMLVYRAENGQNKKAIQALSTRGLAHFTIQLEVLAS